MFPRGRGAPGGHRKPMPRMGFRSPRRFPAADPARPPPPVECPAPSRAAPRLRPPAARPRPPPAGMPPRPVAARAAPSRAGRSRPVSAARAPIPAR